MSVATIKPHLTAVSAPDALRALPGWVIWRYEAQDDPEAKPRKVPYYANGSRRHGVQGRPEDRAHLVTFEAACSAAARKGFDGVGLALMPEFGITALDFDDCVGAGGVHGAVAELVDETYAEFSPSGRGVRAFFKGDLGNRKDHGAPFGFETFTSKGFVTFTGNALAHVEALDLLGEVVAAVPEKVRAYCLQRFGGRQAPDSDDPLMTYSPALGLTEGQLRECLDVLPDDLPYDQWLAVGMAIHHETGGQGFELWDEWSGRSPKYTSAAYGEERWRSFGKGDGAKVTARSLLKLAQEHGARVSVTVDLADFGKATDKPLKFKLVQAAEFAAGKHPGWIVKDVLPRAELAVVYGESGAGKTFAVLDLMLAVARGQEWRGQRCHQGRVVYVAAEGSGGVRKRLAAYAAHHGVDLAQVDLYVVADAPNLLLKDDAGELARAVASLGPAAVVVVDTLAQATPGGNENAGEDMGRALAHCKAIHRKTGALVVLVHHSGKDASKGARGWSGIKGALDAEIEVVKLGTARVVQVTKQKDGDDRGRWAFDLVEVPLGADDYGDLVSSCVVVEADMPATGTLARVLGPVETVVNAVVQEFAQAQSAGIEVEAVLSESVRRMKPPEGGKRDTRKQAAKRALLSLCTGDDAPYAIEEGCLEVV